MKVTPCKFCGYPPNTMPPIQRTNGDHVWICPVCRNEGDADVTPWKGQEAAKEEHGKPVSMKDVLETKAGG